VESILSRDGNVYVRPVTIGYESVIFAVPLIHLARFLVFSAIEYVEQHKAFPVSASTAYALPSSSRASLFGDIAQDRSVQSLKYIFENRRISVDVSDMARQLYQDNSRRASQDWQSIA
jgi:hypothetical protein